MKKKTLLHFWLLLCLMVAGATNAWADEITYTFNSKAWGDTGNAWTSGKDGNQFTNDRGVQITSGVTGANATTKNDFANVSKIVVTYSTNATKGTGDVSIQVGSNSGTSKSVTTTGGTSDRTLEYTYDTPQSGAVKITVACSVNSIYIKSVAITYSTGGGDTPTLDDSDLALTDAPIALDFDLYNNSSAQVINYTTSSTGAVTVSDNDYVTTAVDQKNQTITVTPKTSVTPAAQTITVSQEADESYKAGSATFTVNITDSTPIPTHTATFSVNGETSTEEFEEGADIEFPENPVDVNDKTFVGWTTDAIEGTTNDAPEFVTSATMGQSDITYYAVFAYAISGGSAEESKSYGFETESDTDWTIDGPVRTASDANTGIYAGKISMNNTYVTFNNKVKVKAFSFAFKRTSNNNNYNVYVETSEDNSVWTAAETYAMSSFNNGSYLTKTKEFDGTKDLYVRFHCSNTTAVRYVDDISITYVVAGVSYNDYCTTVVADSKQDAELSFSVAEVNANISEQFKAPTLNTAEGFDGTVEYESSDESVAQIMDSESGDLRLVGEGTATITATFAGNDDFKPGVASYTLTVTDDRIATTTFVEDIELDLTEVETLTQLTPVVKDAEDKIIDCTYEEFPPKVSYEIVSDDNYIIGSIDNNSGEITLNKLVGTATLKAYYNAFGVSQTYKPSECTFTITVIDTHAPGAVNNPYSVAEAIDAIDAGTGVNGVYAKGIVSQAGTLNASGEISYYISEDGTTTADQLQAYKGKSFNGDNFTSDDDIQVGDEVVIYGDLTKYKTTYEFAAGNKLVSRKTTPALAFGQESYEVVVEEKLTITASSENSEGAITYTSSNTDVADIDAETGEVQAYAAGTTTITATIAATETYRSYSVDVLLTVTDGRAAVNITEVTAEQTSIVVGNVTNAVVTNDQENWTAAYTFTSDNEEVAMVNETTGEILGITKGTANITATLNVDPEDENYIAGNVNSMSFVITVVNPSHTAHFSFNGTVDNNNDVLVEEGEAIAFPSIEEIPDGYLLIGWAAEAVDGFVFDAPETITNAVMGSQDVTYYAVLAAGKMAKTTDKLDNAFTRVSGNSYQSWSGLSAEDGSDAVYAGNSAGNYESIQLRTNNNNSGIVSTTSGGRISKVTVAWNSNTVEGRELDIYGSNAPYSSAADVYNTSKYGTKLGSIVCGTSTELTIVGDYAYVGVRSNSGAMYLDEIDFTWEQPEYDGYCSVTPTKVTLDETEGYTGTQDYAIVKLNRTVKANTWSTFTVPFDIPAAQIPDIITIKKLESSSLNGEYVTLNFTSAESIEAGVPYMMKSPVEISNIKVYGVDVDSELNDIKTTYAVMKGNMAQMNVPEDAFFISNNTWYQATSNTAHMKAFRAYIELTELAQNAGARGFEMNIDGEVTRIDAVSQSGNAQFNGTAYDLQGRRVEKPVRGLYIINGKKVLVK